MNIIKAPDTGLGEQSLRAVTKEVFVWGRTKASGPSGGKMPEQMELIDDNRIFITNGKEFVLDEVVQDLGSEGVGVPRAQGVHLLQEDEELGVFPLLAEEIRPGGLEDRLHHVGMVAPMLDVREGKTNQKGVHRLPHVFDAETNSIFAHFPNFKGKEQGRPIAFDSISTVLINHRIEEIDNGPQLSEELNRLLVLLDAGISDVAANVIGIFDTSCRSAAFTDSRKGVQNGSERRIAIIGGAEEGDHFGYLDR